jgi:hypothetical protein
MGKLIRNSFPGPRVALPTGGAALSGVSEAAVGEGASRRAFIGGSVGAAAGAAVILATPKVAAIALDSPGSSVPAQSEPKAIVTTPSGPAPHEPVTAYVRDAERGEVTVMSGKNMTTYKDPALVKRLLDAAH